MEEYLSSSEAFAKALKGFQTSPSEKIRLAKEAWRRADVVLPHKQEFLLEWLCSALVKASTPSKSPKDFSSATILDQEYWDLLKDMLTGITHSRKKHRKYKTSKDGSEIIDNQAPGVLLRVPVIPMFTALIQKLLHTPSSSSGATPATTTKTGKKAKASVATAPTTQDKKAELPSESVLESAFTCLELLSSPHMSEWFQPTLEQYTPLVQVTLEAVVEMVQESSATGNNGQKQITLMAFAHIVLDRFRRLAVIQPNQKKVFALVAGKMFEALIKARLVIRAVSEASSAECQEDIGAILRTGLFHQEHLQEYTAGYLGGDETSIQSYQKQLFEQIATLIKSDSSAAVLDVLPALLRYFVEESRRRQRSLASGGFERGLESARDTEFTFFKIIYILAKKQLPQLTEEPSETSIGELANIIEAHNHLLATILELNMYQPSNDETADQFVFMSTSFNSVYSCLTTARALSNGRLQGISLSGVVVLAQLDDRLLKPHLDSLWPVLFSPLPGAQDAALELVKTLLEIYGKASDLKALLTSMFSSLRGYLSHPEQLESCPLFSQAFLDLVPTNIRNYMPLPQAPTILDVFVTELMTLDSSMEIEGLEPITESSHKKKRKLNSGKSRDHTDDSSNHTSLIPSADPIITILIQFLKGLRVTANQEKRLNQEFKVIYDHFLKSIFEKLASEDLERTESYQQRRLIPALKLHYALCKASAQYWAGGASMKLINRMVKAVKGSSGWTDPTVLTLNRVVLQHVHMTLCSAEFADQSCTQHCQDLVRFTMKSSRLQRLVDDSSLVLEPWDGRLENTSGNAFLVASWQIQVSEWLDIVCRFGTTQHMTLIAKVIVQQFSNPVEVPRSSSSSSNDVSISIHLLNQILLRSANFYEVPNFRPIFAQIILQRLADSITALSDTGSERKLAAMISSFTETADATTKDSGAKVTFVDALKELVNVRQELAPKHRKSTSIKTKSKSDSVAKKEQGPRLLSLLSIMHLLPLEYFEKFERNIILTTMALLEHYIQSYLDADATGVKCLLLARHISNAIMGWRSDAGVLLHDPAILLSVLNYSSWYCSTSYGTEDVDGLGRATMETTASMVDSAVRYYMMQAHDVNQQEAAWRHLHALLDVVQGWASHDLLKNETPLDGRITESRIHVVIISRVCQSLVYCQEQEHRHSRSKSKSKTITGATTSDTEASHASLAKKIAALFETVQSNISKRIQSVIAVMKKGGSGTALTEKSQQCMDDFELYRTVVQYYQLNTDKNGCLDLMPGIFLLASALVKTITESRDVKNQDHLVHLTTILTGYSCQYLPLSDTWQSTEGSDSALKTLLQLLLTISGQDLEEQDVAKLKEAYLTMLGLLSAEMFESALQWLLEEACPSESKKSTDELVLVRYLEITFLNVHHTQKRKVRRQISKLLTRLTQILQITQSVPVVAGCLDIMAGICSEPSFELRSWEVGLVLEGIASLMSPATPLISQGVIQESSQNNSTLRPLTNQDTSKIFTALYHVLINVARFRQEELTTLIPVFTAIVQGLFHGFKSLHGSIAKRQQGVEALIKSPFMLLSAGALLSVTAPGPIKAPASGASATTLNIVMGDPLPVECAENFARLLTALGSKGVNPLGSYGGGSYNSNNNAVPEISTTASSSTSGGGGSIGADASKAFGKHAPYILMEYFQIQCSVVASISQQSLRNALLPGLYALLSLCSDWEREMMMVGLDNTGKTLLKGLYADYLKYHKYTGR
ncbi:hypothetical protein EDD11_001388 [Mortierella claussenii]|nr:hypothetical protein EDD11_001388 [Mortierella claussenii]